MRKSLVVEICVFDAAQGQNAEAEQQLIVDIAGTTSRIWLSTLVAWAAHSNKVLEIVPAPDKTPNFFPKSKLPRKDSRHVHS